MQTRLVLVITLLLAACIQNTIYTSTPSLGSSYPTVTTQENNLTKASIPSTPYDPGLQSLIEKAKGNLARKLSISETGIILVKTIDVVWLDSSLGCPRPGIEYIQVLNDGFLIYLEAEGNIYQYHTNTNGQIVLCDNLDFPIIPVTPGDIQDGIPWVPVN